MLNAKRCLSLSMVLLALAGLTGCKKHYLEGFNDGEVRGYDNGYGDGLQDGFDEGEQDGYDAGFAAGELYFTTHDNYQNGFNDGKVEGLSIGYNQGYTVGYNDGLPVNYNQGYTDGHADGLVTGYNNGYSDGHTDGNAHGYNNGYNDGYDDSYNPAYADGYDDGYDDGYSADHSQAYINAYNQGYGDGDYDGYSDGYSDGYNFGNGWNQGYNDGFNDGDYVGFSDGYNVGFDDGYGLGFDDGYDFGFDDGYWYGYDDAINGFSGSAAKITDFDGLPNNKAANLNPFVKLAANLQNDLVNYKKLKKIEHAYAKGLEAKMLEEGATSSKDLAKIATMKEQFRIKLVASELASQFSLSAERSQKIATLSATWRKLANHRAVTHEDAEQFGKQLIGMNLTEVIDAVKASKKGDVTGLDKILEQGSQTNKISKAHMSHIIVKMFF